MSGGKDFALLKIKPINILFVENERRSESHFIVNYRDLSESPGVDLVITQLEFTFAQRVCCVNCQISEIGGVPKDHTLNYA